jgi:hypothetical protein
LQGFQADIDLRPARFYTDFRQRPDLSFSVSILPRFLWSFNMSFSLSNFLFFSLCLIAAIAMLAEGGMIVLMKKQIVPFPTRILARVSALAGGEKGRQRFSGQPTPKELRSYASFTLIFGVLILISSFVYLFTAVL